MLIIAVLLFSIKSQAQNRIDTAYTAPGFNNEIAATDSTNTSNKQDEDYVITVEQMPEFKGDLLKFLSKKVRYPKSALENKIEGKVIVQFIIEKDGSISNVEIVKKAGWGMDEEAIRVIKLMPNWKPGKQNGKAVRVLFTLPINFKLK